MVHKLNEISDLAEAIAEENISKSKVNLTKIAKKKNIEIIYENYGDAFLGELVHQSGRFYIHINLELLQNKSSARTRFTLAHEFGHYFIDEHRNLLKGGTSISHDKSKSTMQRELEADHFASNLLMPKSRFAKKAKKFDPGLRCVLNLKDIFDTSIESTAIHYVKMNLVPCILIKWQQNLTYKYSSYNYSFSELTNIKGIPNLRVDTNYINNIFYEIETSIPKLDYIEEATLLSKWIASIAPGSKQDLVGLEQTFKWGDYGGFTFLIFPQ